MIHFLAFSSGVIAGYRPLTTIAAIFWTTALSILPVADSFAGAFRSCRWVATVFAAIEIVVDKNDESYAFSLVSMLICLACGGLAGLTINSTAYPGAIAGVLVGVMGAGVGLCARRVLGQQLRIALSANWSASMVEDLVCILALTFVLAAL